MQTKVHGIHHVTAIAGLGQQTLDFYVHLMGLRLVKKSVNQDVPDTYHLFFADAAGTPGTDLTFFLWPDMGPARPGAGFTAEVPFAIPPGSLAYWQDRFSQAGVGVGPLEMRFGEKRLPFRDPQGLPLALIEAASPRDFVPWEESSVPAEYQLRGMHSVRLWERNVKPTEMFLTQIMGFRAIEVEDGWHRYAVEDGAPGTLLEIKEPPDERHGQWGTGGVHHVAWRVRDVAEQLALREAVEAAGLRPTPPIDRFWFQSVYFREPGGTLFELATDGPGFDRDEEQAHLGEQLILPPWLESHRAEIERALPPLTMPTASMLSRP